MDNTKAELVKTVRGMMSDLETDVSRRNSYVNTRFWRIYKNGVMSGLRIRSGSDMTQYNYLDRVVEIHAAQLFGRMPQIVSSYDKEDLSVYDMGVAQDDQQSAATEKEKARLRNGRRATDAEIRNTTVRNIQADNDMETLLDSAAEIGGWAGFSVIKGWLDRDEKKYKFSLIEQPQNFARYWTDSNFREGEADFYSYQISKHRAKRLYGEYLEENESFTNSAVGGVWWKADEQTDFDQETLPKCWVIEATGYFPGFKGDGKGGVVSVAEGEEEPLNILIVGDKVVQVLDKDLPTYYVTPNLRRAGDPWGISDVSDDLVSINQTMIETMSDWRTASWKITFPKVKLIGFGSGGSFSLGSREAEAIPLEENQDVVPLVMDNALAEFPRLMSELWASFTKKAKISRVMLDDPSVNTSSNSGMLTSMKPMTDVTEKKQKLWNATLVEMFSDALNAVAELGGEDAASLKEAVKEEGWKLSVKWPSILRKEDPTYQQMYNNRWTTGSISAESYLEAMGDDWGEEIDRIRDDMTDPLRAAMIGRSLPQLAATVIAPPGPDKPDVRYNVSLRGETTPQQEGNIASMIGINDGPFPASMGPQGNGGLAAQENADNAGFVNGNPYSGGTPIFYGPDGKPIQSSQAAPINMAAGKDGLGQAVSTPGSGAPAVTPQGSINQTNQRAGV